MLGKILLDPGPKRQLVMITKESWNDLLQLTLRELDIDCV
jgi:hypothetical protein